MVCGVVTKRYCARFFWIVDLDGSILVPSDLGKPHVGGEFWWNQCARMILEVVEFTCGWAQAAARKSRVPSGATGHGFEERAATMLEATHTETN